MDPTVQADLTRLLARADELDAARKRATADSGHRQQPCWRRQDD